MSTFSTHFDIVTCNSAYELHKKNCLHESRIQRDSLIRKIEHCQDELLTIISDNSCAKKTYDHRSVCPPHHKTAMKVADHGLFNRSKSLSTSVCAERSYTSGLERPVIIERSVYDRLFNRRTNALPMMELPPPPAIEEDRTYFPRDSYNIPNYASQPTMTFHAQRMDIYITDLHSPTLRQTAVESQDRPFDHLPPPPLHFSPTLRQTAIESQDRSFDHLPPPPPHWMINQNADLSFEKQASKAANETFNTNMTKPHSETSAFQELQSKLHKLGGPSDHHLIGIKKVRFNPEINDKA